MRLMPDELPPHLYGPNSCLMCFFSENACGRCLKLILAQSSAEKPVEPKEGQSDG